MSVERAVEGWSDEVLMVLEDLVGEAVAKLASEMTLAQPVLHARVAEHGLDGAREAR